jgi:hypothetical protein
MTTSYICQCTVDCIGGSFLTIPAKVKKNREERGGREGKKFLFSFLLSA